MGRSTEGRTGLSEQRKYRTFTAQKKLEIVLAGLRGDRSVREVCREHAISETLYYGWRDQLLEASGSGWPAGGAAGRAGAAPEGHRVGAGARPQDVRARDRGKSLGGLTGSERARRPVSPS